MRQQFFPALRILLVFTLLFGVIFPVLVFAAGRIFAEKADGSLMRDASGTVVGSSLVGQQFESDRYFHSRPSAAGQLAAGKIEADNSTPALNSGASNLGPTNPTLIDSVANEVDKYRLLNDVPPRRRIPIDAVTSSGSGVDPDISIVNARLQAPRIAMVRGIPLDRVNKLIESNSKGPAFGIFGTKVVNVLSLNLALDRS